MGTLGEGCMLHQGFALPSVTSVVTQKGAETGVVNTKKQV